MSIFPPGALTSPNLRTIQPVRYRVGNRYRFRSSSRAGGWGEYSKHKSIDNPKYPFFLVCFSTMRASSENPSFRSGFIQRSGGWLPRATTGTICERQPTPPQRASPHARTPFAMSHVACGHAPSASRPCAFGFALASLDSSRCTHISAHKKLPQRNMPHTFPLTIPAHSHLPPHRLRLSVRKVSEP